VLLVDHDEAEVAEGREHGRARPDTDAGLTGAQPPPLVVALAGGQLRVQDRDSVPEAGLEAGHGLGGQRDLGHEDDGAAPGRQCAAGSAQVDLGLA